MFTKGRREDTEFGEGSDTAQGITPTHHQFAVADLCPLTSIFPLLTELNFCYFPRFMQKPEDQAREKIDKSLTDFGWILQNRSTPC